MNYRQEWAEGDIEVGTLLDVIEELQSEAIKRSAQINELEELLIKRTAEHAHDIGSLIVAQAQRDQLRDELERQDRQCVLPPIAIVNCGDDGYWADILPDRTVEVGQMLYAIPQYGALKAQQGKESK